MSSARFFTCLIISNLKKRKEIKRVKVRMHLNLHKELCRLDGEVLNLDLDAVFRFVCKMLMCRETLEEGKQHFWEWLRSSHMKSFGFCFLTDSSDWCQVQENISLRKYSLIYLVVFNLTQSFILPCRRNLRHSIAECLIEITIIYNNNTTVASGDEPFHRCDSPKIPGFFKSLFIFFSLFSTLQGFQSSVLLSL